MDREIDSQEDTLSPPALEEINDAESIYSGNV
jgi:hypothetical protein